MADCELHQAGLVAGSAIVAIQGQPVELEEDSVKRALMDYKVRTPRRCALARSNRRTRAAASPAKHASKTGF